MSIRGYQHKYSEIVPIVLDKQSRLLKAEKILKVLEDYYQGAKINKLNCLDIGCSGGIIDFYLAKGLKSLIAIDIDTNAVKIAKKNQSDDNIMFMVADAMMLSFTDCSFDIVICNHVYAHVPDYEKLMEEIHRVLKVNGICYFAAGNRLSVIEDNYKLPFLSWLPKRLADIYIKKTRGIPSYHEKHLTLKNLRRLVKNFTVYDYTLKIITEPDKFGYRLHKNCFIAKTYQTIASALYVLIPTYIWILCKKQCPKREWNGQ